MKKTSMAIAGILAISFALPAVAGPNWTEIHKAEDRHKAEQQNTSDSSTAEELKDEEKIRDFGPRALTTPWVKKEEEQMIIAHAHDKKSSLMIAHPQLSTTSHS